MREPWGRRPELPSCRRLAPLPRPAGALGLRQAARVEGDSGNGTPEAWLATVGPWAAPFFSVYRVWH